MTKHEHAERIARQAAALNMAFMAAEADGLVLDVTLYGPETISGIDRDGEHLITQPSQILVRVLEPVTAEGEG